MHQKRIQAILQLDAAPRFGPARLNALFDALATSGLSLECLLECDHQDLVAQHGFAPDQADQCIAAAHRARWASQHIESDRLSVVTRSDAYWPANFQSPPARSAMPWLFVIGDPSILQWRSIGIGGSRDATLRSMEITRQIAQRLVDREIVIVSGGARGVDSMAHNAALSAGGHTIVVLAQGIATYQAPERWRLPIRQGRLAIVSGFSPMDDWESFRAIQRNGTIAQMSDAFVIPQSGPKGGTFSAGQAALKMKRPLHVVVQTGEGAEAFPGNEHLIRDGGTPLRVPVGRPIPEDVVEALVSVKGPPVVRQAQLEMF